MMKRSHNGIAIVGAEGDQFFSAIEEKSKMEEVFTSDEKRVVQFTVE